MGNNIVDMMRKTMKGSTIPDYLANNAIKDYKPFDFPDENILLIEEE
jgi:hypothetical protein